MKSNIKFLIAATFVCLWAASCNKDEGPEVPTDFSGGCEAVDLGLSVKWASYNVGATASGESGSHFAWGETQPKEDAASWSNYKWSGYVDEAPLYGMTKYTGNVEGGDGLTTLLPEDDAATVNWGSKWRTPTFEEMKELFDSNKCRWTMNEDKTGYTITSLKTSNSIFLPAARWYGANGLNSNFGGAYWTSSVNEARLDNPYYMYFYHNHETLPEQDLLYLQGHDGGRFISASVRAVTEY